VRQQGHRHPADRGQTDVLPEFVLRTSVQAIELHDKALTILVLKLIDAVFVAI
jgi:hypothetical protein